MKNRDARGPNKKSERQTEIAGKLPYHRVNKQTKIQQRLKAESPKSEKV